MLEAIAENLRRRGLPEGEVDQAQVEIRAAMNDVAVLWHNNLRYASEAHLSAYLKKLGRHRGVKAYFLKKNASVLLKAAKLALKQGESAWPSR